MVRTYTGTGNFFSFVRSETILWNLFILAGGKSDTFSVMSIFYCHWVEWLTSWHFHRPMALKLRIKPLSTTITLLSRYEVVHNIRPRPSNTHLRYLAKLESQSASFVDPIPNLNTPLSQGTIFPSCVTSHRADILTSDIVMMAFILSRGWV